MSNFTQLHVSPMEFFPYPVNKKNTLKNEDNNETTPTMTRTTQCRGTLIANSNMSAPTVAIDFLPAVEQS